jgi:hypothetical protein
VANFTATPTTGQAPLLVAFTDASTGNVTSRTWSFGDGGTSTAVNPSHTFSAGTFTVTLTVNGPGGSDVETKTNLITVSPPPTGELVLQAPVPGTSGTHNSFRVTGATPNSVVGFYIGTTLGSSLISRPGCPLGVPIGLASSGRRPLGTARANALGVTTLSVHVPAGAAGRTFLIQAVDEVKCQASNLVTEVF